MTRQKEQEDQAEKQNKRGDRKGESNNSPEIPDRNQTSDIPGFLSGDAEKGTGVLVLMRLMRVYTAQCFIIILCAHMFADLGFKTSAKQP